MNVKVVSYGGQYATKMLIASIMTVIMIANVKTDSLVTVTDILPIHGSVMDALKTMRKLKKLLILLKSLRERFQKPQPLRLQ